MPPVETIRLPPVVQYQYDALWCPERYGLIEGSTKCGKTYPSIVWLLEQHLKTSTNQAVTWLAPIYSQAKIAFRRVCQDFLGRADPAMRIWEKNESELWVSVKGCGRIWFRSADHPDGLYGDDNYAVVIDEATRCDEASWHAMRSTLTATGGPVRAIGNVKGRKNWHYAMCRRAESGEPGMHYAKITAKDAIDAGVLEASEIEDARRNLPEAVFRELYFCEPSEDGANPFGMQHISACVRPMSNREPVAFGGDLARHQDWTVVIGLDGSGDVCRLMRVQKQSWESIENQICQFVGDAPAFFDEAGIGDPIVERLQRRCPRLEGFNTATKKRQLIESLIVDVQQRKVGFPDGPVRMELEAYEYQPTATGRVGYGAPEGMHDDCVTALALAAMARDQASLTIPAAAVWVQLGEQGLEDHGWQ